MSIGTTAPATGLTVFGCGPDEAALFRTIAPRFGVRPTVTEAPVSERNAELARGNRCVSVGHQTPVTNPTLRALSRTGVEYVSTRSVGHDHIDVDYAQRVGVTVGTVAYSPDSVADYTLMLILMALRHTGSVIRRADARDYRLHDTPGRELRDLTVGVVGTGRIGSAVLDRLAGFGCRTLAHDRRQSTAARYLPLDDLLRHSDVVTLHTPLDAGTRHLLGRRRIALMKSDAVLVNTGRGALVDTGALLCALDSGRLGGAALDVVEGEQGIFYADCRDRVPQNIWLERLQRLPNVLVTPHTAFHTDRAVRDTVESTLVSCLEFESEKRHG